MLNRNFNVPSFKQALMETPLSVSVFPALVLSGLFSLLLCNLLPAALITPTILVNSRIEICLISWAILFPVCFLLEKLVEKLRNGY